MIPRAGTLRHGTALRGRGRARVGQSTPLQRPYNSQQPRATVGRTSSGHATKAVGADGDAAAYGIALCALLLFSPVAWVHHYLWVLPAAAIALGLALARWLDAPSRSSALVVVGVAVACVALCWTLPFNWDTQPHPVVTTWLGLPLRPLLLELRAGGTLLIAGVLATCFGAFRASQQRQP